MTRMKFATFLVLVTANTAATMSPLHAEDDYKLSGTYFLDRDNCGKNGSGDDCVLSFTITGAAAKLLFNGMKTKAVKDECTEGQVKDDGDGMRCFKIEGKTFECDFGYHFSKKKLTSSNVTC